MTSQIFKYPFPKQLLIDLLEDIAIKSENSYIINNSSFKKGLFNNIIINFIEQCKSYYYLSKHKYLERKINYKSFITIIRQICKYNKISYNSKINYNKSKYDIIYSIYFF